MKTICSFQFELTQKLKQLNIKFLIIPLVKREAESLQSETFLQKYKLLLIIQLARLIFGFPSVTRTKTACEVFSNM